MSESYQHSDSFLLIRNRKLEIDNKNLSTTPNYKSTRTGEWNSPGRGDTLFIVEIDFGNKIPLWLFGFLY